MQVVADTACWTLLTAILHTLLRIYIARARLALLLAKRDLAPFWKRVNKTTAGGHSPSVSKLESAFFLQLQFILSIRALKFFCYLGAAAAVVVFCCRCCCCCFCWCCCCCCWWCCCCCCCCARILRTLSHGAVHTSRKYWNREPIMIWFHSGSHVAHSSRGLPMRSCNT